MSDVEQPKSPLEQLIAETQQEMEKLQERLKTAKAKLRALKKADDIGKVR